MSFVFALEKSDDFKMMKCYNYNYAVGSRKFHFSASTTQTKHLNGITFRIYILLSIEIKIFIEVDK